MNENLKKRLASLGVAAGLVVSGGAVTSLRAGENDVTSDISYVQDVDNDVASDISYAQGVDNDVNINEKNASSDHVAIDSSVRNFDFDSHSSLNNDLNISSSESYSALNDLRTNISSNVSSSVFDSYTSNSTSTSNSNIVSNTPITKSNDLVSDNSNIDYENFELMNDAIAYSFSRFNSSNESLSSALESTYGVKLSEKQKSRYDTIMKDTHEAYKKAIDAYKSGDMDTFRTIRDDILKNKKYLNLDDLVDILSIGINLQGDYIKDSSNYSITDGKLVIDGVTVDSMFSDATYVDQTNVMSLIQFYDKKDETGVLDLMQVPIFVARQATNPTNLSLVQNGTVYTYNEADLRKKFSDIMSEYNAKLGEEKINDNSFKYYNDMLNQYYTSYDCRVGYFSGSDMKDFLKQYEDGIDNIKIPENIEYIGLKLWDAYSLMQDANGYALDKFNKEFSSLSEALETNYNVNLSEEQKSRYDSIMADTNEIYKKGIELYKLGHVDEFKKICDDILVEKKYLNLNDLIDILSININKQGNYIKDSSNYSITDNKLVIDGITVQSLFSTPSYVYQKDVMSLINMYNGRDEDDTRVLDIMQVPIFVASQAINPCNFTIVDNDRTVYEYNNNELKNKFDEIYNSYSSKVGLDRFYVERSSDGTGTLYAYDVDNNRKNISGVEQASGLYYFLTMLDQYRMSERCKVGYFGGDSMKQFLTVFENGIDNVKTPQTYSVRYNSEYESYSLMQDTVGFIFNGFNSNYSSYSLTELIESNYGVKLSDEQKSRYDTIINDTYNAYKSGIAAYEDGRVYDFRKICEDILLDKKYLNRDDLIDIVSTNINSQGDIIKDSKNYSVADGKLVIDGVTIEKLFDSNGIDNVVDLLSLYAPDKRSDTQVLDIMQVPKVILMEATNPNSYSLVVNGKSYLYSNDKINQKIDDINNYFSSNLGLNNFGFNKMDDGSILFYGFDNEANKQYIDNNNEYIDDLSLYLTTVYPSYEKSKDGRIGYFDGEYIKNYLSDFDAKQNNMTK